jgi:hypothetical protein
VLISFQVSFKDIAFSADGWGIPFVGTRTGNCIADGLCKFLNASVFIVSCGLLECSSQNLYLLLAQECVKLTATV